MKSEESVVKGEELKRLAIRHFQLFICAFAGVAVIIAVAAPHALLPIFVDAISAAVVLLPACLGGLVLVPLFKLGPLPMRWHLLLGSALGLGCMSTLVLLLGLVGVMQRPIWIVILAVSAVAGVLKLRSITQNGATDSLSSPSDANPFRYAWALVVPFVALALLAASNAPGFIWAEEGFGYDVLEYHLQLPKEYLAAGQIGYLPHNVYANFPAAVEMLYLLAMIVLGDVQDVGTTANMIHLYLAAFTVFAAWVAGREWSPRAGVVCGVVIGTVGWLPYLSGLAYVENGMLFFGMTAMAGLMRWFRLCEDEHGSDSQACSLGWIVIVGVAAGFACACKYTAVPMIALPIGLIVLCLCRDRLAQRCTRAAVFLVATLAAMSPWLVKNQIATGNPVFPLANSIFEASPPGWGDEQTQHWNAGHALRPEKHALGARLRITWDYVFNDKYARFGPAVFLLGAIAVLRRRWGRVDVALVAMAALQFSVWVFATHLYARFIVVWLIPLALLAGRSVWQSRLVGFDSTKVRHALAASVLVLGAGWNLAAAARLHRNESSPAVPARAIYEGLLPGYEYFQVVNQELAPDARILLVGDAKPFYFQREVDYCVVFNHNPFLARLLEAEHDSEVVNWLRGQGYTHILVNWSELRRLANTYGLSPNVSVTKIEGWFDSVTNSGLNLLRNFRLPASASRYIDLYAVADGV